MSDFYYNLPEQLIAQHPLQERDQSRLMVLDKQTGQVTHRTFRDVIDYLNAGDCLVLNDSRVLPARLHGTAEDTGAPMEFLLLHQVEGDVWEVIVRPGKRAKPGRRFLFGDTLRAEVLSIQNDGNRLVRFEYEGLFVNVLDRLGEMPLPPYIKQRLSDKERYQTVYARQEGSAAAPTAGLHFTKQMLHEIEAKGVRLAYLTLHVGLGTFRPVKVDAIEQHNMHSEYFSVSKQAADTINQTKAQGGRVVAVGTTSARTLETVAKNGAVCATSGWTDIFIYPPYQFQMVDRLITNFHLPESTLLMLISAMAGRENVLAAYEQAIEHQYRFFSFGDAMMIV